ncbi:hypothetical protein OS493_020810 [Desmophyllum pertusum]|uniref:Uncharacterized protein n=1 Tax=Desmophyllum pertusum TaxID=174260 RepID=A0A9W9YB95_9CNID|nr:hypothetical protein OS493_020810 [Desmophyllum pertusum]
MIDLERFGECNNILIDSLKENAKNKNTRQSTNNWLKVWKSWAAQKGHDENIESFEPEDFYATVHSSKAFFNHSAKKTVVKYLKTAGIERSSIVKVTGHRNLQSLNDYDEADEKKQWQLSDTISSASNGANQLVEANSTQTNSSSSSSFNPFGPFASGAQGLTRGSLSQMPNYISGQNVQRRSFMNFNSFHNCSVTFNMGSGNPGPEIQPQSAKHAEGA